MVVATATASNFTSVKYFSNNKLQIYNLKMAQNFGDHIA